jgi:hypothetical protein
LIHLTANQPSGTGQATALVADRRQDDAGASRGVPDELILGAIKAALGISRMIWSRRPDLSACIGVLSAA